jgi:hypothetical protein
MFADHVVGSGVLGGPVLVNYMREYPLEHGAKSAGAYQPLLCDGLAFAG